MERATSTVAGHSRTFGETIDASVFHKWREDASYRPENLEGWAGREGRDLDGINSTTPASGSPTNALERAPDTVHRILSSTAVVVMISAGVVAATGAFLVFEAYVDDGTFDGSQTISIVYEEEDGAIPNPPPQKMTDLGELEVWLGLLAVNVGIAVGIIAGVAFGVRGWWSNRKALPPSPGRGGTARAVAFAVILILAVWIPTRSMQAIGDLRNYRG